MQLDQLAAAENQARDTPSSGAVWLHLGRCRLEAELYKPALAALNMALALLPASDCSRAAEIQQLITEAEAAPMRVRGQLLHLTQLRTNTDEVLGMGTGAVVWDAGRVLAKYLEQQESSSMNGKQVLELGAGTGLTGIAAAMLGASVVLTDLSAVVPLIEQNIRANSAAIMQSSGSAIAKTIDWGSSFEETHQALGGWEFSCIVAADCLYNSDAIEPLTCLLVNLLQSCCTPNAHVLWCHKRRHQSVDAGVLRAWKLHHLEFCEVDNHSLHPMHREGSGCVTYKVSLTEGVQA